MYLIRRRKDRKYLSATFDGEAHWTKLVERASVFLSLALAYAVIQGTAGFYIVRLCDITGDGEAWTRKQDNGAVPSYDQRDPARMIELVGCLTSAEVFDGSRSFRAAQMET